MVTGRNILGPQISSSHQVEFFRNGPKGTMKDYKDPRYFSSTFFVVPEKNKRERESEK